MKKFSPVLTRFYGYLMQLYPSTFRDVYGDEMLAVFSDIVEDAAENSFFNLVRVCLHELSDLLPNVLKAHWETRIGGAYAMQFLRSPIPRGALVVGLAFMVTQTTFYLIMEVMQGQGWIYLLGFASSHGWQLNYGAAEATSIYFSSLILGSLLAGLLLAFVLRETHRIRQYLLASLLAWTVPFALYRLASYLLGNGDSYLGNTILPQAVTVLIGLGFGGLFSMVLKERSKTPWLLLTGLVGYYAARALSIWLFLPRFSFLVKDTGGLFSWYTILFAALNSAVMGIAIGALLGAVSGWVRRKTI